MELVIRRLEAGDYEKGAELSWARCRRSCQPQLASCAAPAQLRAARCTGQRRGPAPRP